jgi:hypothetical protein
MTAGFDEKKMSAHAVISILIASIAADQYTIEIGSANSRT